MRAELRVDECVLERLLVTGVLGQEDEEDKDREEEGGCCEDGEEAAPGAEESDSSAVTGGGALRRTWRKVWRKISGNGARQRRGESKSPAERTVNGKRFITCPTSCLLSK